ncbi:MAG: hypothetical protein ACRDZ7_13595 [Acidimicrobiia bacterium]
MRGRAMLVSVLACATLTMPVPGGHPTLATADPAPMSGMSDSRTLRFPVIATGVLRGPDRDPVEGAVAAYAWPTNIPMSVGDVIRLTPVGWTNTGPDGAFVLRSQATPELERLAEANGGYVNLSLEADAGGRHEQHHFSRHLGTGREFSGPAWRERPELEATPIELRFDSATFAAGRDAQPLHPCWAEFEVVDTKKAATVVGELNPEEDTIAATFTYGEGNQADSDISIGVRSPDGNWATEGSHHLGNSDEGRTVKHAGPMERLRIANNFDYHLYRTRCGNREQIVPHGWRGGVSSVPHLIPDCSDPEHDDKYENGSEFRRERNRGATWGGAAHVFGASLSARSGYSKQVQVVMNFGDRPVHHVCGDNADAMHSNFVWTGINVEGPPCQPGRPC